MQRVLLISFAVIAVLLAGVVVMRPASPSLPPEVEKRDHRVAMLLDAGMPIQPLPAGVTLDARKVALGKKLFHDVRLSKDDTISCATCHDIGHGGSDGKRVSTGVDGIQGTFNSPTVLNSGFNIAQFWDGRAATLEDQVDGPMLHPGEMGSVWSDVERKLAKDAALAKEFAAIYTEGIAAANIRDAIAEFERSLITHSRFDRFLEGAKDALSSDERAGYELFLELGCVTCHQGENIGGGSFQKIGVVASYLEERGNVTKNDFGRFNVTGKERDKFKFKVPTLRNVSKTAPYFHDGSVATIEEAVQIMAQYQLGERLQEHETQLIVSFLRSLDGEAQQ